MGNPTWGCSANIQEQKMQKSTIEIKDDEFWDKFKPIKNHIDKNASYEGCMFETYGPELDFVKAQAELTVWTIMDCDGKLIIGQGYQHVNRIGYLITLVPAEENTEYNINDDINDEIFDGDIQSVASIMIQDLLDVEYDTPDEVAEWQWIQANASFNHVDNGKDGVFEFALNMSRTFENIPKALLPVIEEAKVKNIAYLIFHQGT